MSNTQEMSPQGYNIDDNPYNINPFWEVEQSGVAATIDVGTVTTEEVESDEEAEVSIENVGSNIRAIIDFDFKIPKGEKGDQGIQGIPGESIVGPQGNPGVTPNITVSGSVLPIGGSALPIVTVTKTGTNENPNFDFEFANLKGEKGDTGPGVPAGGTAGQVLSKIDGTDYNTEWKTPQSGGGGISFKDLTLIKSDYDIYDYPYELTISGTDLTNLYNNYNFIKIEFFLYSNSSSEPTITILNVPIGKDISNFPGASIETPIPTEDESAQGRVVYYAEESNESMKIGFKAVDFNIEINLTGGLTVTGY